MVDPQTLILVWAAGFYGFAARWRWIGGMVYVALTLPLIFLPILH